MLQESWAAASGRNAATACVEYYQGARSLETAYSTFLLLNLSGVCVYVCVCFHMGIYLSQQVNFPSSECHSFTTI